MLKSDIVSSLSKLNGKVRPAKPNIGKWVLRSLQSKVRSCSLRFVRSKEGRGQNVDMLPAQQGAYRSMGSGREKIARNREFDVTIHVTYFRQAPKGKVSRVRKVKICQAETKHAHTSSHFPFTCTTVDTAARSILFA